ncbi:MAG: hypothetical protein J6S14_13430 [Clostridia bacterium]|nr:hypothetical protein [Clostridia bacterium]
MARFNQHQREMAYRFYVADCLRIITENTAKSVGGAYVTVKFSDVIDPKPADTRTGAEIAADVINRAGIEVIG